MDAPHRAPPPDAARLRAALARLGQGLVARDEQVRCVLLAALCGEHVLLLGPPGTAKSEVARRLRGLVGGRWFERLLTRFTVPEELFGPLSLAALDEGRWCREVDGYLPTATVAFLDEVFKANSSILNALLTLLNERAFDQGPQRIAVPLWTLVAASNEMPTDAALQAFLDRFLFRCTVSPVPVEAFAALLASADSPAGELADDAALSPGSLAAFAAAAGSVAVPDEVVGLLAGVRDRLAEWSIDVSDRRWVRTVRVLRIVAASHGRARVEPVDLGVLRWLFATDRAQTERIDAWFADLLGGDRALECTRLARLAQAWDKQLEIEQTATELAFDDSGKLALARGLGGADASAMADAAPRMSAFSRRRRFSPSHVRARLAQLDALIGEVDAWLDGAARHRETVITALAAHLWIVPSIAGRLGRHLDDACAQMSALRRTLDDTRAAFAALPLADLDDGRAADPISA